MIVDAHVHAGEFGKHWSRELCRVIQPPGSGLPERIDVNLDDLKKKMDASKVDKAFLFAHDLARPWKSKCPNEYVASFVARNTDRFVGFASVDPLGGDSSVHELKHAVKNLGLKGLKLLPAYSECAPGDPRVFPVYEAARDLHIPVTVHTGFATSVSLMGHDRPDSLDDVAIRFPDLKIIVAHMGLLWSNTALMLMWKHRNVFGDISAWGFMPFDYLVRTLCYAKHLGVTGKILWGTDYPSLEPIATQAQDIQRMRRIPAYAARIGIEPTVNQSDIEAILGDNALKVVETSV